MAKMRDLAFWPIGQRSGGGRQMLRLLTQRGLVARRGLEEEFMDVLRRAAVSPDDDVTEDTQPFSHIGVSW